MECNQIRELLPDLAAGMETATPEIERHITTCSACATLLRGFQQIMSVLDEWQAPEPSPYFDSRLQARLSELQREEIERPAFAWLNWMNWLRRPAVAMSLAAVLFAGAVTVGIVNKSYFVESDTIATAPPSLSVPVEPGTAVGDLQALEKNDELYADFDMLDELQVQDDVTANP